MKWCKFFKEGDKVIITHTHHDDLGKTGIIVGWHRSYCDIQILNPDGTPEICPQNNKPKKPEKHPYKCFVKIEE